MGGLLGLLLLGFTLLCGWWNPQVSLLLLAALLLLLWTGFTGALHLDGLADSADAWVGGLGDRERTLAIMKDPQSGPMGVTAVVLALLLKLAAIFALLEQTRSDSGWNITLLAAGLLLIPMLARASVLGLLATTPYVRSGGMASDLVAGATPLRLVLWGLLLAAMALLLVPAQGLFLLALWLTLVLLLRQQLLKRLGAVPATPWAPVLNCRRRYCWPRWLYNGWGNQSYMLVITSMEGFSVARQVCSRVGENCGSWRYRVSIRASSHRL